MAALDYLQKDKSTTKYKYTSEAAVKRAVQEQFVKYGILFEISFVRMVDRFNITTLKGGVENVLTCEYEITLEDVDSDAKPRVFRVLGSGTDSADKGAYKGLTGAARHGLSTKNLIPTGDDPEGEGDNGEGYAEQGHAGQLQQARQFAGVSGQQYQPVQPQRPQGEMLARTELLLRQQLENQQWPAAPPSNGPIAQASAPHRPAAVVGPLVAEIQGEIRNAVDVIALNALWESRKEDLGRLYSANYSAYQSVEGAFTKKVGELQNGQ